MSTTAAQHKDQAPNSIACAVITVSDTRTLETDRGGALLTEMLGSEAHRIVRRTIVPDEPAEITATIRPLLARAEVQAILITGGTGISRRDQTYETVLKLIEKPLPGYGELFRHLSYEEIGPAAMLSRAVGGITNRTIVLTMPGSPAAVRLAMEKLILPELPHLVGEATK